MLMDKDESEVTCEMGDECPEGKWVTERVIEKHSEKRTYFTVYLLLNMGVDGLE